MNNVINVDIEVDETLDLPAAFALGEYNSAVPEFTVEHFPLNPGSGTREVRAKLVYLTNAVNDEQVNVKFLEMGYKRGGARELLAVGAQYPELQLNKWIVSGAFLVRPDGSRWFLSIGSDIPGRRTVGLAGIPHRGRLASFYRNWFGPPRLGGDWFLAVPE
jgi:hypothetical protein